MGSFQGVFKVPFQGLGFRGFGFRVQGSVLQTFLASGYPVNRQRHRSRV